MALRSRLAQLQKAARSRLTALDLPSGRIYFDKEKAAATLFLFASRSTRSALKGEEPPPVPPLLEQIGALRTPSERRLALDAAYSGSTLPFAAFDLERFYETGEVEILPGLRRREAVDDPDDNDNVAVRIGPPPS